MDFLKELVDLLSDNESKQFIEYLKKQNKRSDTKNIVLYKCIKTDDLDVLKKIYGEVKNNDAYHALRKRLTENLIDFIGTKTLQDDLNKEHQALRFFVVANLMFTHEKYKIGFKCLKRAENLVDELEQFSLKNEILLKWIQYVQYSNDHSLDELTEKLEANHHRLQQEGYLSVACAKLRLAFKSIQLNKQTVNTFELIENALKQFNYDVRGVMTYNSLAQMLYVANEFATIQQNFSLITPFINQAKLYLSANKKVLPSQLPYHLQIVYFLANFYFRSKAYDMCEIYLSELKSLISSDSKIGNLFIYRYYLILGLNTYFKGDSFLGKQIIEEGLQHKSKKITQKDLDDLHCAYALLLALDNDEKAIKYLTYLLHTDAWYEQRMGMVWTMRKNLMEILIHAQFKDIEWALTRLTSFKRRYSKFLKQTNEYLVLDYIYLVEKHLKNPIQLKTPSYQNKWNLVYSQTTDMDVFLNCFLDWFNSKIHN